VKNNYGWNGQQCWNPWKGRRGKEEFDDGLYPIFVTQDEVRGIFDKMIYLELKEKDLIDSKIPIFTIMKFEKKVIFK
jgi:hypothetical protein